jgi:hypothetical protein
VIGTLGASSIGVTRDAPITHTETDYAFFRNVLENPSITNSTAYGIPAVVFSTFELSFASVTYVPYQFHSKRTIYRPTVQ